MDPEEWTFNEIPGGPAVLSPPPTYIRAGSYTYLLITPDTISITNGLSEMALRQVQVTPEMVVIGTGEPTEPQARFDGSVFSVVPSESDLAESQVYASDPNKAWGNYTAQGGTGGPVGILGVHTHSVSVTISTQELFRAAKIRLSNLIRTSKNALSNL